MGAAFGDVNRRINERVTARANLRPSPRTTMDVLRANQREIAKKSPYSVDLNSISTAGRKAGDRDFIYDDEGDTVGVISFKEQKRWNSAGDVIGSKIVPRTHYYSDRQISDKKQRKIDYGNKSIAEIERQLKRTAPSKAKSARELYNKYDPGRGPMQGHSVSSYNQAVNYDRPLLQAFQDLNIPAYKEFDVPELDTGGLEYDKTKLYTNYGKRGQLQFPSSAARQEYYEKERTGTFHNVSGLLGIDSELGDQTMVWVKNPPKPSKWKKFLSNPVLQVVGLLNPTVALATTGAKLASGVDVSPVELASSALTGLNMAGVTKPPALGDIPVGGGPPQMTQGTGLFGTTYGQTQTALNVAAAGDAKGAALALLGPQAVKEAIDKVPDDRILNVLQKDDVQAGLNKVVERVAGGAEFDEALAYGLGTYIKEGGGLNIEGTDVSLGVIEDVVRDIVRPIGKAGTALADFVEEAMPDIDTSALDPIEKAIRETGRTAEDIVRAGGKAIDKSIIQPTREVAKALDDAVTQPVGDALSALDTAIRQALPDINLPSIDLPSMDLPFDLRPSLVSDTGEDFIPSPTRTTDSLFNDELFQFETEIGISDYPLVDEELELFYPESAPQLDYAPDYDNFFENTIYEAKPRSYDF